MQSLTHNQPERAISESGTLDPGATPRLESALRCLYASLSCSIPTYILQALTIFGVHNTLWLAPVSLLCTLVFSTTLTIITFRDRARLHPRSMKSPPAIPALCRLPTIIFAFLIGLLWVATVGITIFVLVVLGPGISGSLGSLHGWHIAATVVGAMGVVLGGAQIALLFAVGILGAVERKGFKRSIAQDDGTIT